VKNKKSIKPSTTVGMPIMAVKKLFIIDLPRKSFKLISIAIGVAQSTASMVATPEKKRVR
jgi:hypothetical protein